MGYTSNHWIFTGWGVRMVAVRRHLLTTVSLVAFATAAGAADLRPAPVAVPVKAVPPVVAPWSWAGFYIGLNAGAAWNHARFTDLGDDVGAAYAFPAGTTFWSPNQAGFTGGGQAGFNLQSGNVVYGLEGDLNYVAAKTSVTMASPNAGNITATTDLDWMATLRGRLGVAFGPALIYATGGLAVGHFKDNWGQVGFANQFSSSKTRAGWTAGGGLEYMLTRNWTAKIEGLYSDFGNWTVNGTPPGAVGSYRSRFAHEVVTVRGGLNWKW